MKYVRTALAIGFAVVLGLTSAAQAAPGGGHGFGGGAGAAGHPGFAGPGFRGPHRAAGSPGHPGEFHGHPGEFHEHPRFHGRAFVGVAPFVYAPGYIYEPPVVAAPPEYVPGADGYWYYCQSAGAYYPTAPSCPEPWIPVANGRGGPRGQLTRHRSTRERPVPVIETPADIVRIASYTAAR